MQGQAAEQIAFGYQHHHTNMWDALKKIFKEHGVIITNNYYFCYFSTCNKNSLWIHNENFFKILQHICVICIKVVRLGYC